MNSTDASITTNASDSGGRLGVVNGLRGIAILGVLYIHLFQIWEPPFWNEITVELPDGWYTMSVAQPGARNWPIPVWAFLSNSWLGVNLFFVLSGFVLFRPYANGWRTMQSRSDLTSFYRRRWQRLMPLYFVCVAITMAVYYVLTYFVAQQSGEPWPDAPIVRDILLMATVTFPFTSDMWYPRCNWVLWSLGIEIWFSVLFPLLVVLVHKFGMRVVYVAAVLIALAIRVASVRSGGGFTFEVLDPVRDCLLARIDDFATGMGIAFLFRERGRYSEGNRPGLGYAMTFAGIFLMWLGAATWDWVLDEYLSESVVPYINLVVNVGAGLLLAGLLTIPYGFLHRLFGNGPLQVIGMMCFSIYVWHGPLILWIFDVDTSSQAQESPDYFSRLLLIYLPCLVVVTILSYRFIEFGDKKDWRPLFRPAGR